MHSNELYFKIFRENTIGYNQTFQSPHGEKKIVYADWIASGRLYRSDRKNDYRNFWSVCWQYSFGIK